MAKQKGRPKMDDYTRKTKRVFIRCNEEQYNYIVNAAAREGKSVSEFLLERGLE